MADENNNNGNGVSQDPKPNIDTNGAGSGGAGADPGQKPVDTTTNAFDPSKIGDEDFEKVLEDPRLWSHSRIKTLKEKAKKAEEIEAERAKAEEEALKKKGEFETLAQKAQAERDDWKNKYSQSLTDNAIQNEAAKLGARDLSDVLKLIDRANIKIQDDGSITGVEEAVKTLIDAKPYLKGDGVAPTIGSPTNPNAQAGGKKMHKLSDIQNAEYYKENAADIDKAYVEGRIVNDTK